jgi:hypothetical protein
MSIAVSFGAVVQKAPRAGFVREQALSRLKLPAMFLAGILVWLLLSPAYGQITFPAATPISAGNFIVREQPFIASGGQGYQAYENQIVVVYGLTPNIAFVLDSDTYVYQSAHVQSAGQTLTRSAMGFGDTEFVFRYTIMQEDDIGSTLRVAPILGVEIPTWMDDQSDRYGRVPPILQPGWGAWDPLIGNTFTWQTLDWSAAADIVYQFNTPARGYQFGNVFRVDGGFHYRLWPWPLSSGVPAEIYASLEANLIYAGQNQAGGIAQPNTGGISLFIDPAIIYTTAQYGIVVGALLPAVQQLNGAAVPLHYEILLLFRWSFFTPYHL